MCISESVNPLKLNVQVYICSFFCGDDLYLPVDSQKKNPIIPIMTKIHFTRLSYYFLISWA